MELHGAAAQMNILLENQGTPTTVIAGLTMTLRVFRIDATFAERNSRYAFAVPLKDHATLWDAIEELRHLHSDSNPNSPTVTQICEWMAVLTKNILLGAYSYPMTGLTSHTLSIRS